MNHPQPPARLVLVDDHRLFAEGLSSLLAPLPHLEVIEHYPNGKEAVKGIPRRWPDLVLMDLEMPVMNGLEACRLLQKKLPCLPILILSMHDSPTLVKLALDQGAMGYLLKDSPSHELLLAIDSLLVGRRYFSPRVTEEMFLGDEK